MFARPQVRSEARLLIESFSSSHHFESFTLRQTLHPYQKQIPKIIHQTYRTANLPSRLQYYVQTWRELNPGWEVRFYDDQACLDFVTQHFPQYLEAYVSLPKSVEQSDFFRYLIIYKFGGVYTDIDTECKAPLDDILMPTDTMVVGWEHDSSSSAMALKDHYVRTMQVLQWTFMAAPGHPALLDICEFIKSNYDRKFSDNANRDTLEKTGPGIFTDTVLKHAWAQPPLNTDGEQAWPIRFLPRIALGAHPLNKDGLLSHSSDVKVLHHFMGKWKKNFVCWNGCKLSLGRKAGKWIDTVAGGAGEPGQGGEGGKGGAPAPALYPVSVDFDPPFEVMVQRKGELVNADGSDESDALTLYGRWQRGPHPSEHPTVMDALIGSLGGRKRSVKLIDVGAGLGAFSLAAAARGHAVDAFEMSPAHLYAFRKSIERNGFGKLITPHAVALASHRHVLPVGPDSDYSPADAHRGYPVRWAEGRAERERQRGLAQAASASWPASDSIAFEALDDLVSDGETVGALRVSANGWEGAVLSGASGLLSSPTRFPSIVVVEMNHRASVEANQMVPSKVLFMLHEHGYTRMYHAGPLCRRRWKRHSRRHPFAMDKPSTWCALKPEEFALFGEDAKTLAPEAVIFYRERDWEQDPQVVREGAIYEDQAGEGGARKEQHASSSTSKRE